MFGPELCKALKMLSYRFKKKLLLPVSSRKYYRCSWSPLWKCFPDSAEKTLFECPFKWISRSHGLHSLYGTSFTTEVNHWSLMTSVPSGIRTSCELCCSGSIDRLLPDVYQNILLGYNQTEVCLWLPREGCSKMHALAKLVAEKKICWGFCLSSSLS